MLTESPQIFKDVNGVSLKFKICRGPERQEIKELVMLHGGSVVDKKCDATLQLIGPEQTTSATNTYSTEFIKKCILAGKLLDPTPFLIIPENEIKAFREDFTSQDHQLVKDFVINSPDIPTGNKLYKDLERKYPHHTWQSWRDYSIKKLLPGLGVGTLQRLREEAQKSNKEQENLNRVQNQYFNPQDWDILSNFLNETNGDLSSLDYFNELYLQYPHHSAESWRQFAVNSILKSVYEYVYSTDEHNSEIPAGMSLLQRYLVQFEKLSLDFDFWDRNDILMALFMSSGSMNIAREILQVGFSIDKIPADVKNQIFTQDEDYLVLNSTELDEGERGLYEDIVLCRGAVLIEERRSFLKIKPKCGRIE